ncbi:MAG: SLC13 family permease [Gammaproteobacteria bacterium]|nr:SLC13 family permease [Gammaproteobacteria bacterium]
MTLPAAPDAHGIAVLVLVGVALVLFTRERLPLETSSLIVLVVLTVGFEVFPYTVDGRALHAVDFFSGFGHEALVAVAALMMAGQGLVRTGALEPVGRGLARIWAVSPMLSLLLTLVVGAILSAFVNNVPIVVLLLPVLVSIALRTGQPASGMLLPMGFATLVGGMSTTIGTSTNLLVVGVAADMGLKRFGMFDFFLPAAIAAGVAILYLWLVAPRLLPQRDAHLGDASPRIFTAQLRVEEEGFADGATLAEVRDKAGDGFRVVEVRRDDTGLMAPLPDATLRAGDRLTVRDTPQNLKEYEEVLGARLYNGDEPVDDDNPLDSGDQQIAEIVVTQGSPLEGRSLGTLRFFEDRDLLTLALHRTGREKRALHGEVADVPLRVGDVLLVQGDQEDIADIKRRGELLVLDATADLPHTRRAPLALAIMAGIVVTAALGLLPIAVSALAGVLLMLLTGCLRWSDAAASLSTAVVMIVVASLALGSALLATGGADYLARLYLAISAGASPAVLLAGLMLTMAVFTNVVSNNAAAVIGTPIAVGIAAELGLPAEPFVLAVLFGANMSYATPMAYKTNLLVMNAGGYTFGDFVRVGVPLTLLMWVTLSWLLAVLYPI